jgi:hypothetical protein
MKNLKIFSLIAAISLCNMAVHPMEAPVKGRSFIEMTMVNIQNLAAILSHETGEEYSIIIMPEWFQRCLHVLGLDSNSTPLDIKYHYQLLKQKLSKDSLLYEAVEKAYNQLMKMLFELGDYQEEVVKLEVMNFAQVESLEFMHTKMQRHAFQKYKHKLIEDTISALQANRLQQPIQHPTIMLTGAANGASSDIHTLLNLSAHEPFGSIQIHYQRYMEKNSPNKLIALRNTNEISHQDFKNRMAKVKEVEAAYARYLEEYHLKETPKRRATQ